MKQHPHINQYNDGNTRLPVYPQQQTWRTNHNQKMIWHMYCVWLVLVVTTLKDKAEQKNWQSRRAEDSRPSTDDCYDLVCSFSSWTLLRLLYIMSFCHNYAVKYLNHNHPILVPLPVRMIQNNVRSVECLFAEHIQHQIAIFASADNTANTLIIVVILLNCPLLMRSASGEWSQMNFWSGGTAIVSSSSNRVIATKNTENTIVTGPK